MDLVLTDKHLINVIRLLLRDKMTSLYVILPQTVGTR